jgi:hypothetical protein
MFLNRGASTALYRILEFITFQGGFQRPVSAESALTDRSVVMYFEIHIEVHKTKRVFAPITADRARASSVGIDAALISVPFSTELPEHREQVLQAQQ